MAATIVSEESQLSCSMVSLESTRATADPATRVLLLEAGCEAFPTGSDGASDSEAGFVHWRAFFYRKQMLQK